MNGLNSQSDYQESIKKLYEDGKSLAEISSILGITKRKAQYVKNKHNFVKAHRTKEELERFLKEGKSNKEIAVIMRCLTSTVVHMRKKYDLNDQVQLKDVLTESFLRKRYLEERASIKQIAEEIGYSASAVASYLKLYGIASREKKGRYAEIAVVEKLTSLGYEVEDMNEKQNGYIYDVEIRNKVRIEVKSAKENIQGYAQVNLINKKELSLTDYRVKLANGYTRKILRKTCDFVIIVVTLRNSMQKFYIVPANEIQDDEHSIVFGKNRNKYSPFLENWGLIEQFIKQKREPVATNNGSK